MSLNHFLYFITQIPIEFVRMYKINRYNFKFIVKGKILFIHVYKYICIYLYILF